MPRKPRADRLLLRLNRGREADTAQLVQSMTDSTLKAHLRLWREMGYGLVHGATTDTVRLAQTTHGLTYKDLTFEPVSVVPVDPPRTTPAPRGPHPSPPGEEAAEEEESATLRERQAALAARLRKGAGPREG